MTIVATLLPVGALDDETVDTVVRRAIDAGCVACSTLTGPWRVAFFQRHRVPAGWTPIGAVTRKDAPCAA